jgi:flagellar hook protein FlgE
MGLASALTTALTGMQAAETQVDVAGNNLANSQTIGFKASESLFATQFLQTQSLGSAPSDTNGGTNPRQTGLGTRVAAISPDFTQGTIELSSNPSDLAIQGEGFFMVESSEGERLYTRNGVFRTNADNELVNLTGQRVLGFGIDESFQIERTILVPLSIPVGNAVTAQPTRNVFLQGILSPSGDIGDTAEVLESVELGDASVPRPNSAASSTSVAPTPVAGGTAVAQSDTGGSLAEGVTYRYRFTLTDTDGNETLPSAEIVVTTPVGNAVNDNTIALTGLPNASLPYSNVNIYRTAANGTSFFLLDNAAPGGNYTDTGGVPLSATPLDSSFISGNYSYVVTFARTGEEESRPSALIGPTNVVNGRIRLSNLPTPPVPGPGDTFPAYDRVRIYRNLATDSSSFFLVDEINPGDEYIDYQSDAAISNLATPGNQALGVNGPEMDSNTLLVNVIKRDGLDYFNVFSEGTLEFTPSKGGRALGTKTFDVTATSTVQDLLDFMNDAMGIQASADDPQNPIPGSLNNIVGESGTLSAGLSIQDGKIRIVSNNGTENALDVNASSLQLQTTTGALQTIDLAFGTIQDAVGESASADFIAYDTLGIPINVRVTVVLESVTDSSSTYRWFADSPENSPLSGVDITVGTGLVTFDGEGNLLGTSNNTVTVERRNLPSSDPLSFDLDFGQVSGLSTDTTTLAATRQDGFPAGTLSSFIIGDDGTIRGVFTSGATRDLGQIRLSRFSNPEGLVQRGQNLFAQGVNSGLPIEADPGSQGIGSVIAGAVELSNTDIGKNLIDLVLATTQYRGNARVISTVQQLLDELLNLRR